MKFARITPGNDRAKARFVMIVVAASLVLFSLLSIAQSSLFAPGSGMRGGGMFDSVYSATPALHTIPKRMSVVLIADQDSESVKEGGKIFKSMIRRGHLTFQRRADHDDESGSAAHGRAAAYEGTWAVEWTGNDSLWSHYSYRGRGLELSELLWYDERLFTVCDKTGIVFEVQGTDLVPRHILADGDGNEVKGFKGEWATVKDGKMVWGSMGKEYVRVDSGEILNFGPEWVKMIDAEGRVQHVDWGKNYRRVRRLLDKEFPAYIEHEAVVWNEHKRAWYMLPRRVSDEPYSDVADDHRGANLLIACSEHFDTCSTVEVVQRDELKGFSTFRFVPGSDGEVIVALRTVEVGNDYLTYITVFDIHGTVLMGDQLISKDKFEGLEIF